MSLAVVGIRFDNPDGSSRLTEIEACTPGEPVYLVPQADNEHDPRAVAVFSFRGVQLGYLSAERCGRIGSLINSGRDFEAVFQGATETAAWIRIAFDGADRSCQRSPLTISILTNSHPIRNGRTIELTRVALGKPTGGTYEEMVDIDGCSRFGELW